jgi:hypothetical protein
MDGKYFEVFSSKPFGTASIGWLENLSSTLDTTLMHSF